MGHVFALIERDAEERFVFRIVLATAVGMLSIPIWSFGTTCLSSLAIRNRRQERSRASVAQKGKIGLNKARSSELFLFE
eukprot:1546387-Amphidinium_carterae.1